MFINKNMVVTSIIHKSLKKVAAIAVLCTLLLNNIAFALQAPALNSLSPYSRLADSGNADPGLLGLAARFQEQVDFIYTTRLIGKVIAENGTNISAKVLRRLIGENLNNRKFHGFSWETIYKEKDTFCLTCRTEDGQIFIVRFFMSENASTNTFIEGSIQIDDTSVSLRIEWNDTFRGAPYDIFKLLHIRFRNGWAGLEDIRSSTEGNMPDGHLSVKVVKEDLGTLNTLGVIHKRGKANEALYRIRRFTGDERELITPILQSLGTRPNRSEKGTARELLEEGNIIIGPGTILERFKAGTHQWKMLTRRGRRHIIKLLARESNKLSGELEVRDLTKKRKVFNGKSLKGILDFYAKINGISGPGRSERALKILKADLGIKDLVDKKRRDISFWEEDWTSTREILDRYEGFQKLPSNIGSFLEQKIDNVDLIQLSLDAGKGNSASFIVLFNIGMKIGWSIVINNTRYVDDHVVNDLVMDTLTRTVLAFNDEKNVKEKFSQYFKTSFSNALISYFRDLAKVGEGKGKMSQRGYVGSGRQKKQKPKLSGSEGEELLVILKEVFPKISGRNVNIFAARYFDDKTIDETAEEFNLSRNSIITITANIIKKIKGNPRLYKAFYETLQDFNKLPAGSIGSVFRHLYNRRAFNRGAALTGQEIAAALGVSHGTVIRDLTALKEGNLNLVIKEGRGKGAIYFVPERVRIKSFEIQPILDSYGARRFNSKELEPIYRERIKHILTPVQIDTDSYIGMQVSALLRDTEAIRRFLKVGHLIFSGYKVVQKESGYNGNVLKITFDTENGRISVFTKLRYSNQAKEPQEHNPTNLEHEFTLKASRLGILPPSIVIKDILIIREIENGVSLRDLFRYPKFVKFFLENDEHFMREIGKAYGRLNKIAGITHGDVELDHIFITKDKKVFLIDLSTVSMSGHPLSSRYGLPYQEDHDISRLRVETGEWLDGSEGLGRVLNNMGKDNDEITARYLEFINDGYAGINDRGIENASGTLKASSNVLMVDVFNYLIVGGIISPDEAVSSAEIAEHFMVSEEDVKRFLEDLYHRLGLLVEAPKSTAEDVNRYFVREEVVDNAPPILFALTQFRFENTRPDGVLLDDIYEKEIEPILMSDHSAKFTERDWQILNEIIKRMVKGEPITQKIVAESMGVHRQVVIRRLAANNTLWKLFDKAKLLISEAKILKAIRDLFEEGREIETQADIAWRARLSSSVVSGRKEKNPIIKKAVEEALARSEKKDRALVFPDDASEKRGKVKLNSRSEKKIASDFMDDLYSRVLSARQRGEKIIIGINVDWIPLEQRNSVIKGLLSTLRSLSNKRSKYNIKDLIIRIDRGNGITLAGTLLKTADEMDTPFSNIIILGSPDVLDTKAFDRLRDPDDGTKGAFFAKVKLPEKFPSYGYIRLIEMLKMALNLGFGEEVLHKDHPGIRFKKASEDNDRIYLFMPVLPNASVQDVENSKIYYTLQEKMIKTKA